MPRATRLYRGTQASIAASSSRGGMAEMIGTTPCSERVSTMVNMFLPNESVFMNPTSLVPNITVA